MLLMGGEVMQARAAATRGKCTEEWSKSQNQSWQGAEKGGGILGWPTRMDRGGMARGLGAPLEGSSLEHQSTIRPRRGKSVTVDRKPSSGGWQTQGGGGSEITVRAEVVATPLRGAAVAALDAHLKLQ
ncbi:unnamed protein product [Calypogeia fissa]